MNKFIRKLFVIPLVVAAIFGCSKEEKERESIYKELIVERWIVNKEFCDDMPKVSKDNYRIYDFTDYEHVNRIYSGSLNGLTSSKSVESGSYSIDGTTLICELEKRYLKAEIISLTEDEMEWSFSWDGKNWRVILVPSMQ